MQRGRRRDSWFVGKRIEWGAGVASTRDPPFFGGVDSWLMTFCLVAFSLCIYITVSPSVPDCMIISTLFFYVMYPLHAMMCSFMSVLVCVYIDCAQCNRRKSLSGGKKRHYYKENKNIFFYVLNIITVSYHKIKGFFFSSKAGRGIYGSGFRATCYRCCW